MVSESPRERIERAFGKVRRFTAASAVFGAAVLAVSIVVAIFVGTSFPLWLFIGFSAWILATALLARHKMEGVMARYEKRWQNE